MSISPVDQWINNKIGDMTLEEYRLACIRRTIDHASQNSVFYRNQLAGLASSDIKCMDDIKIIPTMSSSDIARNPGLLVCVTQSEISRIVTLDTSGTTGNPKRIYFTEDDLELTVEFFVDGMKTLVEKGDKVLILMPGEKYGSVGFVLREALGRLGVFSEIHGVINDMERCIADIKKLGINCVVGIPVQVLELSCEAQKQGVTGINSVLLSADYVPESVAERIEENLGCAVYSHYGMTEMGFGGGVECSAFDGYHLRECDLYFEILDPDSGNVLEDGQRGEVAFTTLNRRGMPLIRYRTGDISRMIAGGCGCGSSFRRLDKIMGRKSDFIELSPQVFISLPELDELIFKVRGIINYKVKLYKGSCTNAIKLLIQTSPEFTGTGQVIEKLMENQKIRAAAFRGQLIVMPVEFLDYVECSTGMVKRKIEILGEDRL
jgi:phenylacetate-CoA ligase